MFHTFIYLQGSQTGAVILRRIVKFHTFIYLQGSQTHLYPIQGPSLFHTFIYLQGSQTYNSPTSITLSFTPLFTYKVLKHGLWK